MELFQKPTDSTRGENPAKAGNPEKDADAIRNAKETIKRNGGPEVLDGLSRQIGLDGAKKTLEEAHAQDPKRQDPQGNLSGITSAIMKKIGEIDSNELMLLVLPLPRNIRFLVRGALNTSRSYTDYAGRASRNAKEIFQGLVKGLESASKALTKVAERARESRLDSKGEVSLQPLRTEPLIIAGRAADKDAAPRPKVVPLDPSNT